ncbi:hypothetical protein I633_03665 [Alteromonas mediterranea 615]|uniref:Uncharacterized protein n=1 Tax=Alteromonas mediterranea 615 TaxID=1300253 RepID=S5ABC6_9ALTE|nr:hypothetical protein I633_03665 [Alteromonas mediterranea 615]
MNKAIRHILFSFIPAWAVGFLLASIFYSIAVLINLSLIHVKLQPRDWWFMISQDLVGLLPTYGLIIGFSLFLAFIIAHKVTRRVEKHLERRTTVSTRLLLFGAAGGLSFLIMLLAMQPILNVTLIAGARSVAGLCAQCLAGVAAGSVYTYLSNKFALK